MKVGAKAFSVILLFPRNCFCKKILCKHKGWIQRSWFGPWTLTLPMWVEVFCHGLLICLKRVLFFQVKEAFVWKLTNAYLNYQRYDWPFLNFTNLVQIIRTFGRVELFYQLDNIFQWIIVLLKFRICAKKVNVCQKNIYLRVQNNLVFINLLLAAFTFPKLNVTYNNCMGKYSATLI